MPGQSGEPSGDVSLVLRLVLPRLHGCEAGRTELGGLHHHGRRMIFTGGKRFSAVLATCEKRRSGLAPKTTQGPETKTESSIFGVASLWSAEWLRLLARRYPLGGGGWPSASLLTTYMAS